MASNNQQNDSQDLWFLRSGFPVLFPFHPALSLPEKEFSDFLRSDLTGAVDSLPSTIPILSALQDTQGNLMLTQNADIAFRSTNNPLVDLFAELEEVVDGQRLVELLETSWNEDSLTTLKIIFNARSIHLGKSSRKVFYRCAGWLLQKHPLTLVANLQWLSRPVIEKKIQKNTSETVVVEHRDVEGTDEDDPAHWDVHNGVSHGYWKDLMNILALAAEDMLDPNINPRMLLNVDGRKVPGVGRFTKDTARIRRHQIREERHAKVLQLFDENAAYRALHLTVARLFADQLRLDLAALYGDDPAKKRHISLCAKWAPTNTQFHDKHTFIASSIAELLHPLSEFAHVSSDREVCLRYAREALRRDLSKLRQHLDSVERHITANQFGAIKYERVPSLAMKQYTALFYKKDEKRFDAYLDSVAEGKSSISGATLLPSTLVHTALRGRYMNHDSGHAGRVLSAKEAVEAKVARIEGKVIDGQWNTLVQRIKDSGTLENSIAVCDVSGSMSHPQFADGTCPMDSSIGLSLLVAEVAKAPFDGAFITFTSTPQIVRVSLDDTFSKKVHALHSDHWGYSTDFVAVFEDLILPMAKMHKVKQEDMVKRVFVFSDMQFDQAGDSDNLWSTSYERIQAAYRDAGYEMPQMVFWNLAGGYIYGDRSTYGNPTAPKPVLYDQPGTAIVSGYSQALLKVFMENNSFDVEEEDEMEVEIEITEEGEPREKPASYQRKQMDPLQLVHKAVSHKAYSMLKVLD